MEMHGEGKGSSSTTAAAATKTDGESSVKVDRPEGYEPPVQQTV